MRAGGPAAAASLGPRGARSRVLLGTARPTDHPRAPPSSAWCFLGLAMAPAEILSGKAVSAYVPARPAMPPGGASSWREGSEEGAG